LNRLINNLLSLARLDSPILELRKTTESIEEIVSASVARLRSFGGEQRILLSLEPDLPLVDVEPLLLEQVLLNLVENAKRYAGSNAQIQIHAKAVNGVLAVQVVDDGPGIPEDEWDKVFEKFYRGRSAGKADGGVGLGLTICRAIIRAHGGRISIQPRNAGGTIVEFTLPAAQSIPFDDSDDEEDKLAS